MPYYELAESYLHRQQSQAAEVEPLADQRTRARPPPLQTLNPFAQPQTVAEYAAAAELCTTERHLVLCALDGARPFD